MSSAYPQYSSRILENRTESTRAIVAAKDTILFACTWTNIQAHLAFIASELQLHAAHGLPS